MIPLLAELPDSGWLLVGAVIVFLLAVFGGGFVLREMRELRSNLANELKREIDTAKEPAPVAVQQPLIVKAHEQIVTQAQFEELKLRVNGCATSAQFEELKRRANDSATRQQLDRVEKDLKDDLTKQAGARKKMHEEIADLQGDVKVLKNQNETQTKQLTSLDTKMDQVLLRLPRASN